MMRFLRTVGLIVLVLAASGLVVVEILDYRNNAEFDAVVWQSAPNCGRDGCDAECVRGRMVRDLTWYYLKPGMPRSEVVALLGNPQPGSLPVKTSLSYDLEMCSGFRMDYDSLVLSFNDRDALIDIRTKQH
jgi:hypothetical protein